MRNLSTCVYHPRVKKKRNWANYSLFNWKIIFLPSVFFSLSLSLPLSLFPSPSPADLDVYLQMNCVYHQNEVKPSPILSGSLQQHPFRTKLITWEILFVFFFPNYYFHFISHFCCTLQTSFFLLLPCQVVFSVFFSYY